MRRGVVVAVIALLLTIATGAGALATVHLTHPRDETAFLDYLRTYGSTSDTGVPLALPPTDQLLAEGDRACDWLNGQPWALWRNDGEFAYGKRMQRYLDSVSEPVAWAPADPIRFYVLAGAWASLCPASVELHMPHALGRSSTD